MDIDRTGDQDRSARILAGGPARQRGSVSYGFRLPVAKLVLFAAALIALGAPQTVASAERHAYDAVDIVTAEEPVPPAEDYPLEAIEEPSEPSEPLIVDDLRTPGVTVAACRTRCYERSTRAQEESILVFAGPTGCNDGIGRAVNLDQSLAPGEFAQPS